jgi:hypothetical protein
MDHIKTALSYAAAAPSPDLQRHSNESFVAYMTRIASMGNDARASIINELENEILRPQPNFVLKPPLEKDKPIQTPERMDFEPMYLDADPNDIYLLKAGRAFLKSNAQDMVLWLEREGRLWSVNETQHDMVITKNIRNVLPLSCIQRITPAP